MAGAVVADDGSGRDAARSAARRNEIGALFSCSPFPYAAILGTSAFRDVRRRKAAACGTAEKFVKGPGRHA